MHKLENKTQTQTPNQKPKKKKKLLICFIITFDSCIVSKTEEKRLRIKADLKKCFEYVWILLFNHICWFCFEKIIYYFWDVVIR